MTEPGNSERAREGEAECNRQKEKQVQQPQVEGEQSRVSTPSYW